MIDTVYQLHLTGVLAATGTDSTWIVAYYNARPVIDYAPFDDPLRPRPAVQCAQTTRAIDQSI